MRAEGGGGVRECGWKNSLLWILLISVDVDKGVGGKTLIHKMWIICPFFYPFIIEQLICQLTFNFDNNTQNGWIQ